MASKQNKKQQSGNENEANSAVSANTEVSAEQPTVSATDAAKANKSSAAKKRSEARALRLAAGHLGEGKPGALPLITRAAALEAEADELDPKPEKKAKVAKELRPKCGATKKDGTQCTASCMEGKATCVDHQPAVDRLTADEREAIGSWLGGLAQTDFAQFVAEIVGLVGWHAAKKLAAEVQNR